MKKYFVTITAIVAITFLEALAIIEGINGVTLAATIGVIAGLGGFMVAKVKK